MIDTIKLTLDKTMYWITDVSLFQKETMNSARGYFTLVQNPTKSELLNGIYKPRLTVTRRFNCSKRFEETLAIELSLPKLIYGNNFDELENRHFTETVEKLVQVLATMGVRVFTRILVLAPVSTVHYSKNIPLIDGSTPHYLVSKIKEANISLALDVNQTDYRNDGHGYKLHSNSYEVAFYDKIHDLEKANKQGDKRAIEKDNAIQLDLFNAFQKRKRFEVLRMEIRLNQRQKIGKLLRDLGINTELVFQNLFSSAISQKVLLHYLCEVESGRPRLLDLDANNPKALLAGLIINNPKLGPLKTLQAFGLKRALSDVTLREMRAMFGKYSPRSWYRLIAETNKLNIPSSNNPFGVIRSNLTTFVPLRLVDFQDQMINNDKYN